METRIALFSIGLVGVVAGAVGGNFIEPNQHEVKVAHCHEVANTIALETKESYLALCLKKLEK